MYIYMYVHTYTWHYITSHYTTLPYIALHYITWHYRTLHYITLNYITLPYIQYIHIHIYIYNTFLCVLIHACPRKVLWAWFFFTHNYVDPSTSMATSVVSFLAHLADWSLTFRKRWKGWSLHLLRPGGDLETRTQTASKRWDFGGNYIVFMCL